MLCARERRFYKRGVADIRGRARARIGRASSLDGKRQPPPCQRSAPCAAGRRVLGGGRATVARGAHGWRSFPRLVRTWVLVGDDPASRIYVGSKETACAEIGMRSFGQRLAGETTPAELLALVAELNAAGDVHGVLVQLPLPGRRGLYRAVVQAIAPEKDVDGLTATSQDACWRADQGCDRARRSASCDLIRDGGQLTEHAPS